MPIEFHAMPTATATRIRATQRDDYDNPVERHMSDGAVAPCRYCLGPIPKNQPYLVLAHRPFETRNAYAETGPIFLCENCERAAPTPIVPKALAPQNYIVRAYDSHERIIYGTGQVTPTAKIVQYAEQLLDNSGAEFVDVRSTSNNCFLCRIRLTT